MAILEKMAGNSFALSRKEERKGYFIIVDGLDGIGKGVAEQAITEHFLFNEHNGKVSDVSGFEKENGRMPSIEEILQFNAEMILTAEPSYCWVGKGIRDEMISKSGETYSFSAKIDAYSLDRLIQMTKVVIPSLRQGINVLQSRCVAATLNYQATEGLKKGALVSDVRNEVLGHEGNNLQFMWAPDLLIIPTINDIDSLLKRIESRKGYKDDNCVFENPDFQRRLKPLYEEKWLKSFFERYGSKVAYLDAGISIEDTKRQAVEIYTSFLKSFRQKV